MDFSLLGLWSQMGAVAKVVVVILLGMSMYAIGIALERFLTFRTVVAALAELRGRAAAAGGLGASRLGEAVALERQFDDAPDRARAGAGAERVRRRDGRPGRGAADAIELELLVNGVSRSMERGQEARGGGAPARSAGAGDHLVVGAVRRAVRHGVRHHHRLPADGRSDQGRRRRSGLGLGRHRRGAADHGGRPGGRHRRRLVLQLLRHAAGSVRRADRRHGRRAGRQAAATDARRARAGRRPRRARP